MQGLGQLQRRVPAGGRTYGFNPHAVESMLSESVPGSLELITDPHLS